MAGGVVAGVGVAGVLVADVLAAVLAETAGALAEAGAAGVAEAGVAGVAGVAGGIAPARTAEDEALKIAIKNTLLEKLRLSFIVSRRFS